MVRKLNFAQHGVHSSFVYSVTTTPSPCPRTPPNPHPTPYFYCVQKWNEPEETKERLGSESYECHSTENMKNVSSAVVCELVPHRLVTVCTVRVRPCSHVSIHVIQSSPCVYACAPVCMCTNVIMCVCVWEREIERACRQPASCLFLKMCIWRNRDEQRGPSASALMKGSTDRMTRNTTAVSHNYSCSIAFNYS